MSKLIVANWKLNPSTEKQAIRLARGSDFSNVVLAPPFPFLKVVGEKTKKAKLGAQDLFWAERGPFTGEVSATQLKNFGVKYVIVGHSERRKWFNETNELINLKLKAVFQKKLSAILCVGEPIKKGRSQKDKKGKQSKDRSIERAKGFIRKQLEEGLRGTKSFIANRECLIIAYEPPLSIGTGKNEKPENTVKMARFIKNFLSFRFSFCSVPVLYGGSVNSKNFNGYLKFKEIDGLLLGGAGIRINELKKILVKN